MKKRYNNPTVEVIKLQTVQMLAESININGDFGDGTGITLGSRQFDYDEDEE